MKFYDIDTHYFPEDCYANLPEPYKSLVPQYKWKHYTEKPDWWDRTYGDDVETLGDSVETTRANKYDWKNPLLCDENGYHDIDIFPGGKSKYLPAVKEGLARKLIFNKEFGGPFRGDINYSLEASRNLEKRSEIMDQLGIEKNILAPYHYILGLNYRIDKNLALVMAKSYNDTITRDCKNNNRYWPLAWLPMQNQNMSENIALMESALSNDAVGVNIGEFFTYPDNNLGRSWGLCEWMEPFWAHANENQYPIFWHVLDCWYDSRSWMKLHDAEIINQWANTNKKLLKLISMYNNKNYLSNTGVGPNHKTDFGLSELSFASFITEGILDKYPNLRLVCCEKGIHWVMPVIETISEFLGRDCSHYLKNWSFTTEPEAENFEKDADRIGYDRLLFATDYPHMDLGGRGREKDIELILGLSTTDLNKEKIANLNATKLFNKTNFC